MLLAEGCGACLDVRRSKHRVKGAGARKTPGVETQQDCQDILMASCVTASKGSLMPSLGCMLVSELNLWARLLD